MARADGWFLYGRIGEIIRCDGVEVPAETKALCREPRYAEPTWYVWNSDSPANRLFGGVGKGDPDGAIGCCASSRSP